MSKSCKVGQMVHLCMHVHVVASGLSLHNSSAVYKVMVKTTMSYYYTDIKSMNIT